MKETNSKRKKRIYTVQIPTLLMAMDKVAEGSDGSKLNEQFFLQFSQEIGLLSDTFGVTELQAVLLSVSLQRGPYQVDYGDFARQFDMTNIQALSFAGDLDVLVRKHLLRYRDAKDKDSFDVSRHVINCLKRNEAYRQPEMSGLDGFLLFEKMDNMFDDLRSESMTAEDVYNELKEIMRLNPDINFVKEFHSLGIKSKYDWLLLAWMCCRVVIHDDNNFRFNEFDEIFSHVSDYRNACVALRTGNHILMKNNLVEHKIEDGLADTSRVGITDHVKHTLLSEFKLCEQSENVSNLLLHSNLQAKTLFYSTNMEKRVHEIESLLSPKKYDKIVERLKKSGLRQGFACLFYGAAGTGKTETVYQLARHTGRDIMLVDVPQIKSKWVGDSEKNIKAVFDRYREAVKRSKQTPILLFNEADAIFGMRKNGAQSAVDKMENSIQNIILQEMENLSGILIATTNLECNLDSAFERRFLYKLRFERPDSNVRAKIWRSMVKGLRLKDAITLSERYELSGGQIENVARKHTINHILFGSKTKLIDALSSYCDSERILQQSSSRVGFK